MNSWQRVKHLAHGVVFVSVCILMLASTGCEDDDDVPNDDNAKYKLGYCAQNGVNAFAYDPGDGAIRYVQGKFGAAGMGVELKLGSQTLQAEPVLSTPAGLAAYWNAYCHRDNYGTPVAQFQLFAVTSFLTEQISWMTLWQEWPFGVIPYIRAALVHLLP